MACRILELAGVHTLATTLFTMAQAVLAAEVGCSYVAPYVNQLRVHFEMGYILPTPSQTYRNKEEGSEYDAN